MEFLQARRRQIDGLSDDEKRYLLSRPDTHPAIRAHLEQSEYPEPNSSDEVPGDADVPEEPNTEVHNDPVPEEEERTE